MDLTIHHKLLLSSPLFSLFVWESSWAIDGILATLSCFFFSWSLFVACRFVGGELVVLKANEQD